MAKLLGKWIDDRQIDTNHILISNDSFVIGRNNANLADLNMFKIAADDRLEFGIEPVWASAPTSQDALANKEYVDATVFGMRDPKDAARCMAVGNVDVAVALASYDGVTVNAGDRIALVEQTNGAENGLYEFVAVGSPLVRTADADEDAEVTQGMSFMVAEGTVNAYKSFALVTADPIVVGTTVLVFVQVPSLGNILLFRNPVVSLVAGDITNGYIDLAQLADEDSLDINVIAGLHQEKGLDYTLTDGGGFTRITFGGDLATLAEAGDKLSLKYVYQP